MGVDIIPKKGVIAKKARSEGGSLENTREEERFTKSEIEKEW